MAIVVPFLVEAGVTAAGFSAATAATAAIATSVVFQVTGVNDKINKAAAKVFGEDLVKIANIAGAVYGAANGGFSLEPAKNFFGIGEAASGAQAVAGLEAATPTLTEASWMADGAANTQAITEASSTIAPTTAPNFEPVNLSQADPIAPIDSGQNLLKGGNTTEGLTDYSEAPRQTVMTDAQSATRANATASNATASDRYAISNGATGANAAGTNAAQGLRPTATQGITPTSGTQLAGQGQQNVFQRVIGNMGDKTIAGLIQGGATAYANSRQSKDQAEARKVNPSTVRGYTYKAVV